MEEDMVYLEELINFAILLNTHCVIEKKEIRAIENLINRVKELEENQIWSEATISGLKQDFIPKSKIREKMEEYEWAIESYDCSIADYKQSQAVGSWNVLRKLLEDK